MDKLTEQDLSQINALARKELTAEEVYTFPVRLCDNEVDRDFERFSRKSLETLAGLFVGKSGLFDHQWTAMGPDSPALQGGGHRGWPADDHCGEPLCYLKGWAYMLRSEQTEPLIAQIEAGSRRK